MLGWWDLLRSNSFLQTIADQMLALEYVDSRGELVEVSDPAQLRVAAGSLGLLGIVTRITYKLDRMSYAQYQVYCSALYL